MTAFSYSAASAVARAIKVLRHEGLRIFWVKLIAELGFYRRVMLLERPLDQALPELAPALPVRIYVLDESEVNDYLVLRPDADRSLVVDRLRAGHMCFVARHEGRAISTCWATSRHPRIEFLACALDLTAGDAYLFDAFTEPQHRGQGVAPALSLHQLRYLRQAGFRRALRATFHVNSAALRAHAKSGFRPVGTLSRLKVGPWQRYFRRPWPRQNQSP